MTPIIMPQVGQDIPCGKIIEWRKRENEQIEKGEIVLVVESEKASFEVEAEESGVLLKILYEAGEEVDVLEPVAYTGEPGETVEVAPREAREKRPRAEAVEAKGVEATRTETGAGPARAGAPAERVPSTRIFVSPSARRVARERGLDLASLGSTAGSAITGSGPGGRIIKRDVLARAPVETVPASAAAAPVASAPTSVRPVVTPEDTVVPFNKMRRRAAERLTYSKQSIPHFYISVDADMSRTLAWRREINEDAETRISITDLIIKAVADALAEFPRMNAHVGPDRIVLKKAVNVGVATAVDDGLLVPVIPDADRKTLAEIARVSRKNAEAARRGSVNPNISGTFTVTSLGMHGVSVFLPVINPPECAILAVGAVERRAVPVSEGVGFAARDMMTLTLACDHRAVDGVYAARFLNEIKSRLDGRWEHLAGGAARLSSPKSEQGDAEV